MKAQLQISGSFSNLRIFTYGCFADCLFLPVALDKPSSTGCSTAFSVMPLFTAFLTALSTFFCALSFAIFPHSVFPRRAVFLTAFFTGVFLAATFLAAFFTFDV